MTKTSISRNDYINEEIPLSKIHEVNADLNHYIEFCEHTSETVKYAIENVEK
ncbi:MULTISPECIES: hypothetical protein [unclassified Methanobrevibacter]|uniref:hypothetical protein n=1 Tax=unclassified Methanobrevibacter TaxID=2638681 RepID=UPI0027376979|nr:MULTISPECIES: hypothetical protein [unclassified Methanobrevibacter]